MVFSETKVIEWLKNEGRNIWDDVWREVVADCLAEFVLQNTNSETFEFQERVKNLDVFMVRQSIVFENPKIQKKCAIKLCDGYRKEINEIIISFEGKKQGTGQLLRMLENAVVPEMIRTPNNVELIRNFNFPHVWKKVAHDIPINITSSELNDTKLSEICLHNQLLVSEFLSTCKHPNAGRVFERLKAFRESTNGYRGGLVRLLSKSSLEGDISPRINEHSEVLQKTSGETNGYLSDVFSKEVERTIEKNGLFHRVLDINAQMLPQYSNTNVTPEQMRNARDAMYTQYESCLLSYLGLASIEELLRGLAEEEGIKHMKENGAPHSVLKWSDDLNVSQNLKLKIKILWDCNETNLRNLAMHGGLLEVESKREEASIDTVSSVFNYCNFEKDPYLPINIAALISSCLCDLEKEISATPSSCLSQAWKEKFWLQADEISFGATVYCDLLDKERANEWRDALNNFVDIHYPCLSMFMHLCLYGWYKEFEPMSSPCLLLCWGLIFEAIYRSTVQSLGYEIIQRSISGQQEVRFQYQMLDGSPAGLARPEIIDNLCEYIPENDQDNAKRVLEIAIKSRNAFSHGAVPVLDQRTHLSIGHLFIKSIQLLMGAVPDQR